MERTAAGPTPYLSRISRAAWTISSGNPSVVVALLDDGFAYWHEDVRDNIWSNPGETGLDATGHHKESNGIDDDGNGYVDDVYGYDFAGTTGNTPDSDPMDFFGHGSHCSGTIGGVGNNSAGVCGVNWKVKLMAVKIFPDDASLGASRLEGEGERSLAPGRRRRPGATSLVRRNRNRPEPIEELNPEAARSRSVLQRAIISK